VREPESKEMKEGQIVAIGSSRLLLLAYHRARCGECQAIAAQHTLWTI